MADGPARATRAVAVVAASYLLGGTPFSQIVARRRSGVDLRLVGTGTVSGTNVLRTSGAKAMITAGLMDVAKGAAGPLLAGARPGRWSGALPVLAAAAAVSGHNWSPYLRGGGGRGFSPALGALAVTEPAGSGVLLVGLATGKLARQTAVGCLVAYLAIPPLLQRWRGPRAAGLGGAVVAPLIVKRLTGNAPATPRRLPVYARRLLLDRDTAVDPWLAQARPTVVR